MFDYTFELEFSTGPKMLHTVQANSMRSAWFGCGEGVFTMLEQPILIRWIKVS